MKRELNKSWTILYPEAEEIILHKATGFQVGNVLEAQGATAKVPK